MDLKITKKRFSEHWANTWTKYVALIVACVFAVSFFFLVTQRRLSDKEELKIVFYGQFLGELESSHKEYLKNAKVNIPNSEYLDTTVAYLAAKNDITAEQAAATKLEAEMDMLADVVILPIMPGLLDDEGIWAQGGTFFNLDDTLKDNAVSTFNYHMGQYYFLPIDEVINSEIEKGNPYADELKQKLENNPEYYYNVQRVVADDLDPYDVKDEVVDDKVKKNWGINLNKLNVKKTSLLVSDKYIEPGKQNECKYVLGISKTSKSHAEAVCFLNWFLDYYAV